MTLREFYVDHYTSVLNTLDEYRRDDRNLLELWNNLTSKDFWVQDGHKFDDVQYAELQAKFKLRIGEINTVLTDDEIAQKKSCLITCGLYHNIGDYEIHDLKGKYLLIRRRKDGSTFITVIKDKITGEEFLFPQELI